MIGYVLAFLLGMTLGAVGIRFGNQSLQQQKKEQLALKKQRSMLDGYRHELADHFARNIALLDKLSSDYRLLHRQVAERLYCEPYHYSGLVEPVIEMGGKSRASNGDAMPPCDYATDPSGLLHSQQCEQDDEHHQ